MDPSSNPQNQYSYPQHPPGFYNPNKLNASNNPNLVTFSNQPQFFSEERNLKYQFPGPSVKNQDFLDPNRNTNSNFKAEGVPNIYKAHPEAVVEHLDLDNFKAKLCPINYTHNHKHCPFYHNSKDRKRVGNFYISELCEFCDNCPNGDKCRKSHNRVEQLYRPEKYKTKFCSFYPGNLEQCDYGIYCSFAHSESDIVVDLIHNFEYDKDFFMFIFKTVWCPFNLIPHDRGLCVYAHNYQDFRRKPNLCHYDPTPCPNWKTSEFIVNYEDACPNHYNCDKSHGWKESEFHPLNYKTRPCPNGSNCQKTLDCSFYHSSQDQRLIGQQIHCKIFKYYPKNRLVTNTFKITNTKTGPQDFNYQDRHNSLTNLNLLNQDFEKNLKIYQNDFSDNMMRNNSVPIFKHNSSTNIPMMSNHTEDQRGIHSYSMTNSDFMRFQEKGQPKNTGTYKNMMWGNAPAQGQNFTPSKPQGRVSNPNNNSTAQMKNYQQMQNPQMQNPQMPQNQNQGQGQMFPIQKKVNPQNQPQNQGKRMSEPFSKIPTHFQMRSNQGYDNFMNNNNGMNNFLNANNINNIMNVNDSFSENFPTVGDKKDEANDKKNKNSESKALNESGFINSNENTEMKGTERLRKIVMLENNEDTNKEKNTQNRYDPESSYDDHNENILKQICEEDQK